MSSPARDASDQSFELALDDDDRRLDALKHVITLLHEPELNAMRDVAGVAAPPRAAEAGLVDGELRERLQQLLTHRALDEAELAEQPHPQVARLAQRARERRVRRRVLAADDLRR